MAASDHSDLLGELQAVAFASGLDRVGVCEAHVLDRARTEIERRKSAGLSDTMQFTFRNPARSTDPTMTLATARSIFVGARSYHVANGDRHQSESRTGVRARVAKYAQADHYAMMRNGLEAVAGTLRASGHRAVVVADENNLVDREVAWKAGLGWFG